MNTTGIESTLQWAAILVITISIIGLVIIYRKQLVDFFNNHINRIRLGPVEIELNKEGLKKLRRKIDIPKVAAGTQGEDPKQMAKEGADLAVRDIVLNRWATLKQIVHDIAIGRNIRLTPDSKTPDVIERLLETKLISPDLADAIIFLFEEGKIVSDNPGKVDREYAIIYEDITGSLVDWMMLNILTSDKAPAALQEKVAHRRQTVVGGPDGDFYFSSPHPGTPIAWLVGRGGKLEGKRFSVDKEHYKIGRNPANDLCIDDDDYVSGNHAIFKYMDNNLFLYDLDSRNGTFVNDRKITGTPCAVRKGDRIQFGSTVFEIS